MRKLILVLAVLALTLGAFALYRGIGGSVRAAVPVESAVPPSRLDVSDSDASNPSAAGSRLSGEPYVGSERCKDCHAEQHESWHRSYHRSMTMLATPENVLAPFDVELEVDGQAYRLYREGENFWVETDDPEWERGVFQAGGDVRDANKPDRRKSQVVMTTGSHHFQAYWIRSEYGRELWQFPLRYDLTEKNWVHRKDVFLGPPEWRPGMHFKVWNDNCIFCHATGGRPGFDATSNYMEHTTITELGIACESCHGPGREHAQKHREVGAEVRNQSGDQGDDKSSESDDSIVNPAKLDHEVSSEICGSCHSNFLHDDPNVMVNGPQFRPGRRLTEFGRFFTPPLEKETDIVSRFWSDGVNRSTGREFMGVKASPCYKRGEMSCLSCHSMHNSEPDDQLAVNMETNDACLQCHEKLRSDLQAHTHHAPDSSGSLCYNCHMPYTNYGLFKATRSHTITSPKVSSIQHKSRPNACNLCHLDKSLAWTSDQLNSWYDQSAVELQPDELKSSAWALLALRGDAGQRAIAAWIPRWKPAQEVAGKKWMEPILKRLKSDPYHAVSYVANATAKRLRDGSANSDTSESVANALGISDAALLDQFIEEVMSRRDMKPIASVE